jgi:hypothetical protein
MDEPIKDKVAHVKKAKQTRGHGCHWPGCTTSVPPALWGCRKHWYMLPIGIRTRIWRAYRSGQEDDMRPSADYMKVAHEAQAWIAENYPPERLFK